MVSLCEVWFATFCNLFETKVGKERKRGLGLAYQEAEDKEVRAASPVVSDLVVGGFVVRVFCMRTTFQWDFF